MGTMYDSVDWQSLQGLQGSKAGYIDGEKSAWPAEGWAAFADEQVLKITVLANEEGEAFDFEPGNAPAETVAAAIAARHAKGLWSVAYVDKDQLSLLAPAIRAHGLQWTDAKEWPAPGVYLWCADWTGEAHEAAAWAPVTPVATQWTNGQTYDTSETFGEFPGVAVAPPAPPHPAPEPPAPPAPSIVTVTVPVVSVTAPGPTQVNEWVACVQSILNGRDGFHLTVDGLFGPVTESAVKGFQGKVGITVDGIVGPQTVGKLLA